MTKLPPLDMAFLSSSILAIDLSDGWHLNNQTNYLKVCFFPLRARNWSPVRRQGREEVRSTPKFTELLFPAVFFFCPKKSILLDRKKGLSLPDTTSRCSRRQRSRRAACRMKSDINANGRSTSFTGLIEAWLHPDVSRVFLIAGRTQQTLRTPPNCESPV